MTPGYPAASKGREWHAGAVMLAVLLVALLGLDIVSLRWATFGKVGVVLWYLSWLALAAHAARCFGSLVRDVVARGRGFATLLVLLALTATVLVATFNTRLLHFETTQEIACTLNCLADSPSWGYTDTCLFRLPDTAVPRTGVAFLAIRPQLHGADVRRCALLPHRDLDLRARAPLVPGGPPRRRPRDSSGSVLPAAHTLVQPLHVLV